MGERSESITGKHVVVIGGTSGIGRAIAQQSAAAGARVTVASRNQKRVDDPGARLAAWCQGRVCDVTDAESLRAFFEHAGQIDHLVLPGNEVRIAPFRKLPIADAEASMASKFWGAVRGDQGRADVAGRLDRFVFGSSFAQAGRRRPGADGDQRGCRGIGARVGGGAGSGAGERDRARRG